MQVQLPLYAPHTTSEASKAAFEAYAASLLPSIAVCELVLNLRAPKSSWRTLSELYKLRKLEYHHTIPGGPHTRPICTERDFQACWKEFIGTVELDDPVATVLPKATGISWPFASWVKYILSRPGLVRSIDRSYPLTFKPTLSPVIQKIVFSCTPWSHKNNTSTYLTMDGGTKVLQAKGTRTVDSNRKCFSLKRVEPHRIATFHQTFQHVPAIPATGTAGGLLGCQLTVKPCIAHLHSAVATGGHKWGGGALRGAGGHSGPFSTHPHLWLLGPQVGGVGIWGNPTYIPQNDHYNTLIILRYMSWGIFVQLVLPSARHLEEAREEPQATWA